MRKHPYQSLPDHCFWSRSIAKCAPHEVDPVVGADFVVANEDKVATAGSCFAQHISRHLQGNGYNYFVTETAHPMFPETAARDFNYGVFTARFGNIYTSRQLVQLIQRAYGLRKPLDDIWGAPDGSFIDPYRPQIQPEGFATEAEYWNDRKQHFAAVRRAIEEMDVFVFTLGLTEAWTNMEDGFVYPVCPGVAGGEFIPEKHQLQNLRVSDVVSDMLLAIDLIRSKNPGVRIILTVSPVPLVATGVDRSVLVSTTYSKSALRAACEEIVGARDAVAYFPSYEIITGNFNRGEYFAPDLRSVTERGVAHVMRLFMKHYAKGDQACEQPTKTQADRHIAEMNDVIEVVCDEEVLAR